MQEKIDRLLVSSGLDRGRLSIQIVSLPEGQVLYEKNPDLSLNPASNVKIVTAAAALKTLGPDFTFRTEFYSQTLPRGGTLQNLWIKGYGDPLFVTEELDSLAKRFRTGGLKEISGDILVDDSFFDRYHLTTYLSDVGEKVYSIVTGPLSFNFNSIEIRARPGRRLGDQPIVAIEPPTRFIRLKNQASTSQKRGATLEADIREAEGNEITLHGSIPKTIREYSFRKGVLDPAIFTGTVLMEALEREGIRIGGGLKREAVPGRSLLILSHSSKPLREVLKGLGKYSNNFIAEQLVKVLGAARWGAPGSQKKGLSVLSDYLAGLGIPRERFVLDNGSGLSKLTRLSSSQIVRVLLDLYGAPFREEFISTLSIAGVDGTMHSKMRHPSLREKVFAKTGTLNGVQTLSGFYLNGEKKIAFSILLNELSISQNQASRVIETILSLSVDS